MLDSDQDHLLSPKQNFSLASATSLVQAPWVQGKSVDFKLYGRRWMFIGLFSALCVVNNWQFIGFAPVASEMASVYGVSDLLVSFLPLCFFVSSLLSLLAAWACDAYDVGPIMLVAAITNIAGAVIRFLPILFPAQTMSMQVQFYFIIFGQLVSGVCQPCLAVLPPRMAATWFGEQERTVSTGIGSVAPLAGIAVGFGLSPFIVQSASMNDFKTLLTVQMVAAACTGLPFFLFYALYGPKPPTPPSLAATVEDEAVPSFAKSLKQLGRNREFWLLSLVFGIGYGTMSSVLGQLGQITECPGHYDATVSGFIGISAMMSGVVGAGVLAVIVDKYRTYAPMVAVGAVGYICGIAAFAAAVGIPDNNVAVFAGASFMGTFSTGLLPVCLEYGVELTFPIREGTSSGWLVLFGNLFGVIVLLGMSALADGTGNCPTTEPSLIRGLWFSLALPCASLFALPFLWNSKLKRRQYELENSNS